LQPVQLKGRLERTMESERRLSGDRTYVPSRYRILIHEDDAVAFAGFRPTVEHDLAESLHARARQRGYTLLERPSVSIVTSPGVARGDVHVLADLAAPIQPPPRGGRPGEPPPPAAPGDFDGQGSMAGRTAVFEVPHVQAPSIVVDVRSPGRAGERLQLRGGTVRIGRAEDNDLVLDDDRVSRHHGQLAARQGTLVYSDLGSTNGSFVNGSRVTEIALGPGDVLHLGGSTLTVQAAT
jgi:hypothetical protein